MNRLEKRTYKKFAALAGFLGGLLVGTAGLAGPPPASTPEFQHLRRDALEARVDLRGISPRDSVDVTLEARGIARVRCVDRRGRTRSTERVDFRVRGDRTFSGRDVRRGRLNVRLSTRSLRDVPRARCPRNTRQQVSDVSFDSAQLDARQGRRRVADLRCTFRPTRRGDRARNVRCRG
ncbi:MAG: hypothetical protein R6X02_30545 [Enhygromyxa sp.]